MGRLRVKTPDGCKAGWTCAKHAPRRGEDSMGRVRIKTPDGCKGGWTCAKHAPGGRGAVGRLRIKTADGCKAGWTCAKHAPRRGEDSMGRVRINYRYYNPVDGRWTRRDPVGINSNHNLYLYFGSNPILYYDILGLDYPDDKILKLSVLLHWYESGDPLINVSGSASAICRCKQGDVKITSSHPQAGTMEKSFMVASYSNMSISEESLSDTKIKLTFTSEIRVEGDFNNYLETTIVSSASSIGSGAGAATVTGGGVMLTASAAVIGAAVMAGIAGGVIYMVDASRNGYATWRKSVTLSCPDTMSNGYEKPSASWKKAKLEQSEGSKFHVDELHFSI